MQDDRHEPRDGEPLADWINRVRPEGTPEVHGQPAFGPDGLGWQAEGWTVVVEINEAGTPTAHWGAPDGLAVIGYSLDGNDGHRTAFVEAGDGGGDPENVEGWPAVAA
jgi:hypothetical protein